MKHHTKEEVIQDLQKVAAKFKQEFPDNVSYITRDYYRLYGACSTTEIDTLFGSFTNLVDEVLVSEENTSRENIQNQKLLHAYKDRIGKLEKEKSELLKHSLFEDNIIQKYEQEILPIRYPEPFKFHENNTSNNDLEAILVLSDFHANEIVLPEQVNYSNEFNFKIMKERLDRIFYYFVYYCRKFEIKKVNLLFLGDLLAGIIHDELERTGELDIVSALFETQDYIISKILEIENEFSEIHVHFLVGNHGRLKKGKPEIKTSGLMNFEYILAKQIETIFAMRQPSEKIVIHTYPSLFTVINVTGRKFLITHGHFMTGSGTGGFAGIPYYSLSMSSAKMYGVLKQIGINETVNFDDILMGHLHTTAKVGIFTGGNLFINGCIIGTNEYSLYKIKSIAKVEQTMLICRKGQIISEVTLRGIK